MVCGVIPARMQSQRLPGKPLRTIGSLPMIHWVYERSRPSPLLTRLVVATDSGEVLAYCERNAIPATLTSSRHSSGTDRLIEVMERESASGTPADIYVNIQGDEPMVTPGHIELLLAPFVGSRGAGTSGGAPGGPFDSGPAAAVSRRARVSTLKVAIRAEEAADPSVVKVVTDSRGLALYFSRAAIPYDRDPSGAPRYFKHLGFYAYTPDALRLFASLPPSPLEQTERLEQLRFLENGISIAVLETGADTIGVDTEEDLRRVERYFAAQGSEAVT